MIKAEEFMKHKCEGLTNCFWSTGHDMGVSSESVSGNRNKRKYDNQDSRTIGNKSNIE